MEQKELIKLLDEIFMEAEKGKIVVDTTNNSMVYPTRFFVCESGITNTKNSSCPTIIIHNKQDFLLKIQKYLETAIDFYLDTQSYFELNDRDFKKLLLTCLILNAGNGDFNNFEKYVETRTNLLNSTICEGTKKHFQNGQYTIFSKTEKLKPNLEGPYKTTFYFDGLERGQYVLPSVIYGQSGNIVCVYAVQGKKGKQEGRLAKDLDRYLRKLNSGIQDKDYIGEVSPSSVASLTMFFKKLKNEGVNEVEVTPFMPLRYQTKHNQINIKGNKKGTDKREVKAEQEWQDSLQFNMTNKLSYLFLRYAHHFDGTSINYNFNNEKIELKISSKNTKNGNVIYSLEELV